MKAFSVVWSCFFSRQRCLRREVSLTCWWAGELALARSRVSVLRSNLYLGVSKEVQDVEILVLVLTGCVHRLCSALVRLTWRSSVNISDISNNNSARLWRSLFVGLTLELTRGAHKTETPIGESATNADT